MLWPYPAVVTQTPFTQGLSQIFLGLWFGLLVPAVTVTHTLLCLPQVLQYRTWCQELEKQLEATGVSETVLCPPRALSEYTCEEGLVC